MRDEPYSGTQPSVAAASGFGLGWTGWPKTGEKFIGHSCLMWPSNMWIGRKHDNTRLPLVLAGGLGGTLQTGRTPDYLQAGDENRKMCSLHLSIMDRMGVKIERFGNAKTRLDRL